MEILVIALIVVILILGTEYFQQKWEIERLEKQRSKLIDLELERLARGADKLFKDILYANFKPDKNTPKTLGRVAKKPGLKTRTTAQKSK